MGTRLDRKGERDSIPAHFPDPIVRRSVELDLSLIAHYDGLLKNLEQALALMAKGHDAFSYHLLRSIPGVGRILSLVLLYEIEDVNRFPRVNEFLSYARLVKARKESNGKVYGHSGKKIGNAHLKWAFSEAAVLFLRMNPDGQRFVERLPPRSRRLRHAQTAPTLRRSQVPRVDLIDGGDREARRLTGEPKSPSTIVIDDRTEPPPRAPIDPVPSARSPVALDWIAVPLRHLAFALVVCPSPKPDTNWLNTPDRMTRNGRGYGIVSRSRVDHDAQHPQRMSEPR